MSATPTSSTRPATQKPSDASVDEAVNPDREYEDATESKLDHTRPPHHPKNDAEQKHKDEPQISVGDD